MFPFHDVIMGRSKSYCPFAIPICIVTWALRRHKSPETLMSIEKLFMSTTKKLSNVGISGGNQPVDSQQSEPIMEIACPGHFFKISVPYRWLNEIQNDVA